ncbi:MAG: hypothetical protein RhofKO_05180 [Rhodothermales bacterium]
MKLGIELSELCERTLLLVHRRHHHNRSDYDGQRTEKASNQPYEVGSHYAGLSWLTGAVYRI